jgi:hypothetical protein
VATKKNAGAEKTPDTIGTQAGQISVELSTRFLEHFSEQLYSSPQKAFEELISNGWDAGADYVDVRIATDLKRPEATLAVLDNGSSMNDEGLKALWHIAASPKKNTPTLHGRPVIGKFGIGKLATYVLANKLTYICKAADGVIRRVTMDYAGPELQPDRDNFIRNLKLDIFEVGEADVFEALKNVSDGAVISDLIKQCVPKPQNAAFEDEFGGKKADLIPPPKGTWTLVILSDLKPTGRELKIGVLRRMLAAALPIGSELAIAVNGEVLASSKIDTPVSEEWEIGPDLNLASFDFEEDDPDAPDGQAPKVTQIKITSKAKPYPHIELPGIGIVTGHVKLYKSKITQGKSEERGASNGFHVNVLGRVVNQNDPSFGEENLSHAVWASFRMTVRTDGLNEFLTTNREQFKERRPLKVFRAFLRKIFNVARNTYDSDESVRLPDGGDILVKSLGVVSLNPLRNVVSETLDGEAAVPDMFDEEGLTDKKDRKAKKKSWEEQTADNIKTALSEVKYEKTNDASFVKFRLSDNTIIVNKEHPFVLEHSRTKAEKELMRTVAMVSLLTDVYALDIGVAASKLKNIREYRDKIMRFRAVQQRRSGSSIARLLLQTQHDSSTYKKLEACVSDALRYLGFQVEDLAKSGEPEGIARAYPTPTLTDPSEKNPEPPLYSFSFDAKSAGGAVAKTGNIKLDGIVEHQRRYEATYSLVVAPGYQDGAIEVRCEQQGVTPITGHDLGKLLEYTVEYGAIPVTKLREMFGLYSPDAVSKWVDDLEAWLKNQRPLTLDVFIRALQLLKGQVPDALSASLVAHTCRKQLGAVTVKDKDVIALVTGLSILVPDLVGIEGDKIVVNASADRVAEAVATQLEKLHADATTDTEVE